MNKVLKAGLILVGVTAVAALGAFCAMAIASDVEFDGFPCDGDCDECACRKTCECEDFAD